MAYRSDAWPAVLAAAALFLAVACGGEGGDSGQQTSASQGSPPASSSGGTQYTVDLDEIFPQGPGRDLVLNNCQNCHTWVPIVVLQMNEEEWARWARDHRPRVQALSDEEFETLYDYLVSNFNPDTPVPELPPALLNTWTSY